MRNVFWRRRALSGLVLMGITLHSWGQLPADASPPQKAKTLHRKGEPDVVTVSGEDKAMNAAIEKARVTVKTFIKALRAPGEDQYQFAIKKPFNYHNGVEHIWLSDVSFDGKLFHGKVANEPVRIKNLKVGDSVTVSPRGISDWVFVDKGKMTGGFTMRVLYNRSSPKEKQEIERATGMKF